MEEKRGGNKMFIAIIAYNKLSAICFAKKSTQPVKKNLFWKRVRWPSIHRP